MSFKYRFIISFVSLEIFFIILIVSINFFAINSSSKQLIDEKIESNISFLEELVKVPISIYDLATLDNLLMNTSGLKYINSIVILDNQDRILSSQFNFKYKNIDEIMKLKFSEKVTFEHNTYEVRYSKIYSEKIFLGSMYIIFDTTDNSNFIKNTRKNTFFIIFFEIMFSTLISYIIGNRLTKQLTKLSHVAEEIGQHNFTQIPYTNMKDEIGILSNSLNKMQRDLSNRNEKLKKFTITLENQKNELVETQKYKDAFFANMSHELKTPLNSINILSSIMKKNKDGTLNDIQVKNMEIINNCGKNLLNLLNDILDISKLEANQFILEIEEFDFEEYILDLKSMFKSQLEANKINLIFHYDKNIKTIFNDKKSINKIIQNLLSNAIKFTSEGDIEFIINDKNEFIEIIVKDQGIGIENDKLNYIFDRFKQVDGSTSRKYGGTGLGLAICKELVDILEGDISVTSQLGVGSEFIVHIKKNIKTTSFPKPVEAKNIKIKDSETKKDNSVKEIKNDIKNIDNKKVYILNNEPIKFFDIVIELKRKGISVIQVETLGTLRKKLDLEKEQMVVLDINLVNQEEVNDMLNQNSEISLFLICEDKSIINENLIKISKYIFEKPLNKNEFVSQLMK